MPILIDNRYMTGTIDGDIQTLSALIFDLLEPLE